nr:hypothetical protein [Tanacetum cinerariifolium]
MREAYDHAANKGIDGLGEYFYKNGVSFLFSGLVSSFLKLVHEKTCNNDKNLSGVQLEHEKEDEFVVVVVIKEDCRMVVKETVSRLLKEEGVSHFEKEVMVLEWMFYVSILV